MSARAARAEWVLRGEEGFGGLVGVPPVLFSAALLLLGASFAACDTSTLEGDAPRDLTARPPDDFALLPQIDSATPVPDLAIQPDLAPRPLSLGLKTSYVGMSLNPAHDAGLVAVADFDRDGNLDLVDANLTFFRGHGDGTFSPVRTLGALPSDIDVNSIIAPDLNGDGWPDLVATQDRRGTVAVSIQKGAAQFPAFVEFPVGDGPRPVASGDFDGDGKLDLVAGNFGYQGIGSSLSLLLGDGKGGFGAASTISTGKYPQYLAACDLNGDGRLDITVGTNELQIQVELEVLLNMGQATFLPYAATPVAGLSRFAISDFNRDGRIDIMSPNYTGGRPNHTVDILLGKGDGAFNALPPVETAPFQFSPSGVGDFNLDGNPDIVMGNPVIILLGVGDGSFQAPAMPLADVPCKLGYDSLVVADLNNDGKPDVVGSDASTICVLLNTSK